MMKAIAVLALAATMVAAFAQTDNTTSSTTTTTQTTTVSTSPQIATLMSQNNLSWEDAAAVVAIAKATGMQPSAIVTDRPSTVTTSFYDLAPGYIIAQQSGKPFSDVYNLYSGGKTWMDVAKQLNVPTTIYNPSNADTTSWTNTDFGKGVWQGILENDYGMTPTDWTYFQSQNVPLNELVVSDVYATEVGKPVRDVYTYYTTNGNQWNNVQTYYAQTTTTTTTTPTTTNQTDTTQTTTQSNQSTSDMTQTTPTTTQSPVTTTSQSAQTDSSRMHIASSGTNSTRRVATRRHHYRRSHRSTRAQRFARRTHRRHHRRCCCTC